MGLFDQKDAEAPAEHVEETVEAPETVEAVEVETAAPVVHDDEDAPLNIASAGGAFIDILEPVEG